MAGFYPDRKQNPSRGLGAIECAVLAIARDRETSVAEMVTCVGKILTPQKRNAIMLAIMAMSDKKQIEIKDGRIMCIGYNYSDVFARTSSGFTSMSITGSGRLYR